MFYGHNALLLFSRQSGLTAGSVNGKSYDPTMTDARTIALDALETVLEDGRPLTAVLEADRRLATLAPRDRAFAFNIVMTTMRRLGQIDAAIAACMERPLPAKAIKVRAILRLGAVQLLFLQTPPHAAVATAVDQARRRRQDRFTGLINAVLRRLVREGVSLISNQDAPRINTPSWLWEAWEAAYGTNTARAIAASHLTEPPLDITVQEDLPGWSARLGALALPTRSLRLINAGQIESLPGYTAGAWWIQDAAAAIPARLLGDIKGEIVIDLCAAPGGKTAQLAAAGADVIAVDRDNGRLARLTANLSRLGLTARTIDADVTQWQPLARAQAVMLDAPCTATGTIRRHPDIRWTRRPGDIANLAAIQRSMLGAAADMVATGGTLIYCVCSLEPAEGPEQITAFLNSGAPFTRRPVVPSEVGGLTEIINDNGDLRSLPCHMKDTGGMDGFYACRLIRKTD